MCHKSLMQAATQAIQREQIEDSVAFIQHHLAQDLRLSVLSDRAQLSPWHFQRIFRRVTGETPDQHVRRLRLERAAKQLRGCSRPVTELALIAGYTTHEAFTRAFKARFGVSPLEYRQRMKPPGRSPFTIQIERRPPTRIAYVRYVGPYRDAGRILSSLAERAARLEPSSRSCGRAIGIYWDDESITDSRYTRADLAITVGHDFARDCGPLTIRDLPGGQFAVARMNGHYSPSLARAAHAAIYFRWLPDHGLSPHAERPPFETYPLDPAAGPTTEICVPIWTRSTL